jgi:hypothetical protein
MMAAPLGAPPSPTVDPTAQHEVAVAHANAVRELTGTGRATPVKFPSQGEPGARVEGVAWSAWSDSAEQALVSMATTATITTRPDPARPRLLAPDGSEAGIRRPSSGPYRQRGVRSG